MSFAYYRNEIPLAKSFIKNYIIFKCISDELFIMRNRSRCFNAHLRLTELPREAYKQYILNLDSFVSFDQNKHVSFTIFKTETPRYSKRLFS